MTSVATNENVDLLYDIRFGERQLQQPNDERSRFEVPKGDKEKTKESHNSFRVCYMIPLTGTSRLPMISPPIYFPIKFCIVFI